MQQGGTLKKRRRRNLTKVPGLSTIPYDEAADNFDGRNLFIRTQRRNQGQNKSICSSNQRDTRIRMSAIMAHNTSHSHPPSTSTRVTRNPMFHLDTIEMGDNSQDDEFQYLPRVHTNSSNLHDRPYFLDKTTMNRLRILILLGEATGSFPWYWDKKKHRVEKWNSPFENLWKMQWFFVSVQTFALTIFQIYSFIDRVTGQGKTYREIFMNSFSVCWYLYAMYYNVNMYLYKDQIRQYINTLLKFNKKYVDEFLIHAEGYEDGGKILMNLSIPSNITQIFVSTLFFIAMPFQPWYLFSNIYPKPWYWLIPGAFQEFVVTGQVITSYLLTSWIVVAHTNSAQFWLCETHKNNDSDYTSETLRDAKTSVETYRALQILCTCFNDCMAPLAVPLIKITTITAMIPCGYVLIRSMNERFIYEFPGILTYPIGVIDCASVSYAILTLGAEMYDLSASFLNSWSQTKHKDFRRILISCPTLKIASLPFLNLSFKKGNGTKANPVYDLRG